MKISFQLLHAYDSLLFVREETKGQDVMFELMIMSAVLISESLAVIFCDTMARFKTSSYAQSATCR